MEMKIAARKVGLEVNEQKTKYMINTKDEDRFAVNSIHLGKHVFERVKEFKYLGANIMSKDVKIKAISDSRSY